MNNKQTLKDSIFKIGKVVSVEGRSVRIKVDKTKNSSHLLYKGELLKNISVGGYIKIVKGFTEIIGKVKGESTSEDTFFSGREYNDIKQKVRRILEIELLGFFSAYKFERGIKELPLIDNECFLLENSEFNKVHDFVKNDDVPITIGSLTLEKGQQINVGINSLFASHIGIFGNTGSGKSYTLAKLYRSLLVKYENKIKFKKNAHFLMIDFNGEYSGDECITSNKKVYNLSTKELKKTNDKRDKFPLLEKDLIDVELISILANATDKTQKPFIGRSISFYKTVQKASDPINYFRNTLKKRIKDILKMSDKVKTYQLVDYIKAILPAEYDDSGIENDLTSDIEWHNNVQGYRMSADTSKYIQQDHNLILSTKIYNQVDNYNFPDNSLTKIIHFLYLQLISDVYTDKSQNEHIAPAINKLKSKREDIEKVLDTRATEADIFSTHNFIILNLNDVNLTIKKTLPLLLSKKIYSEHKSKRKKSETKLLNIIIDEAHNILSRESSREEESWKDYRLETFEEIIKEGRKFGVFLTISSQRPSDISPTIISQLHNYFLHRLINNNDILAIEKTISYLDKLSVESLSILPTGTCILAGLLAQVPVIVDIAPIEPKQHEPDSKTINLVKSWEDSSS